MSNETRNDSLPPEIARKLAESERVLRQYETVLNNTPDFAYIFDLQHHFIYINDSLLKMFGKTWEEAIGKTFLELGYEPWHAEMHKREIDQVAATKKPLRGVVPFNGTNGRRIYDYIFVPVFDARGEVEAVAGTTRDETDRLAAEGLNAQHSAIIESSEDAIISKDLNGIISSWNPAAERVFGYTAGEAIGQPVTILIPPEKIDEEPGILSAIRRGERIPAYETIRVRKDGTLVNISLTVSPILDRNGTVIGASKIARDITERKRAEAAFKETQQRYQMLFESMEEGYCVVEVIFDENNKVLDYMFVDANPSFEKQTGLKNVKSRRIREILPTQEQYWFDLFSSVVLTGETQKVERFSTAVNRWYEVCAFRVGSANRHHVGVVFNDVTERRRISNERQAMLESERAARTAAENAGRMKDEFLATLSHELRTPLSAILGYSALLSKGKMDSERSKEAAKTIERNARLQAKLIEDLLDMNRIISGKIRLDMQQMNVSEAIEEAVKTVRPSAEAKGVYLDVVLNDAAVLVHGDTGRVQQIVWNLLSNAVKFTPRGGRVNVGLVSVESHVEIRVADNGVGIEPGFLPYVFDRFSQADGSLTRHHGGLGLGLAIVKQLAELHGGNVRVESEGLDKGATFAVRLPVLSVMNAVAYSANESAASAQSQALSEGANINLEGVRALIVDDNTDSARLVETVLKEYQTTVTIASSAEAAFTLLSKAKFDILVSDISMPGEDGYQLIRRVRTMSHENRNIPAIALTAFARPEDRRRSILSGFQSHLAKPVEAIELAATIANQLGGGFHGMNPS